MAVNFSKLVNAIEEALARAGLSIPQRYIVVKVMAAIYRNSLNPEEIDDIDMIVDSIIRSLEVTKAK
jgi:hypothetical protein